MRFLPNLLILTLTTLVLAPLARAAPPPLTADFTYAPAAPAPGEPVTFTSTSLAPGGDPIATDWDLDNDGEFDDGRKPAATRAFDAGTHTVRLQARISGPTPRTAVATKTFTVAAPTSSPTPTPSPQPTPALANPTPTPAPPLPSKPIGCVETVQHGAFLATGECLLPRKAPGWIDDGGEYWRSTRPVRVNGVTITPARGEDVLVNVPKSGKISAGTLDGTATFTKAGETITVDSGRISWKVVNGRFEGIQPPADSKLGGLPIVSLTESPQLIAGGTRFAFMVRMPQQFGAPTSDKPVRVTAGGIRPLAAADEGFHFEVENAVLGPIQLHKLVLDYDGQGSWEIKADATLPPPVDARVRGSAGIRHGDFDYADGEMTFNGQGFNIIGPVFLKRIKFRVEITPQESECVPNIGVKPSPSTGLPGLDHSFPGMPEPPATIDYGVPTFALCGEVGLVAGPTVLGTSALSLDAGLGIALYDDLPMRFRAFGEIDIVGIRWAEAELEMHGNGYIKAGGSVKWPWPGVAMIHGRLGLEMRGTQFNASGSVEACLLDWCAAKARAVVSNAGVGVCLSIDLGVTTWNPGLGYRWGDSPTIYLSGCELGPYKTRVTAARASRAPQSVTLPSGLPGAAIAITGADAPPTVTLIGPKGERFTTPAGTGVTQRNPFFVIKDPASRSTQILVGKPSAGEWRVVPEPGSSAITEIRSAQGRRAPKVTAKVERRGGRRVLSYRVDGDAKVTFAERGATAGAILGKAKGRRGTIAFDPADGRGERRHIVAVVEQDGLPSTQAAIATYQAPAAKKPGRVHAVKTARHGGRVRVSWRKDAAPAHIVTLELSDGRRLVRRVDGRSALTVKLPRGLRAKATVRAVARNGMVGR
ncbi:PKD domain-containing protein [Solirubrobacter sp. CPCC 204708]|uniref:PKD domain-containing protein n=1 Tax=Solirubrobacter deserti TaxID=2282478 RepID=A0ABT4REJ2_9ACTN|nr:PKD domain-containing protein [Solirubrobacter deserti]MBE2318504.1 PKD domain-containing protein [Solirubrobacter deserti]MDA0136962.1 PKD domain-containing protein [Solirubrobacter deserti]